MNSGANDEENLASSVVPYSRRGESSQAWQRGEKASTEPRCRGSVGISGLDVLGVTFIIAITALVLSRFHKDGVWVLADQFPVSTCPQVGMTVSIDPIPPGVRPIDDEWICALNAPVLNARVSARHHVLCPIMRGLDH